MKSRLPNDSFFIHRKFDKWLTIHRRLMARSILCTTTRHAKLNRRVNYLLFMFVLSGCESRANVDRSSPESIHLQLGSLNPGAKTIRRVECRNDGITAFRLARFVTSCDCVRVQAEPEMIPPKGLFSLVAKFDLTGEPKFVGDLAIKIDGFSDPMTEPVYRATLHLSVAQIASVSSVEGR